ncbi:FxSxx-COOH system tetratricopeptide repeat protein [Streptomyces sp. NPDC059193]|uniref:FxSxx-COOH system tetratricopeptide repeat protein n=1 Tax=Streptomyces sp. NPDC059193 TaxID=3346763 RepID=UPI0036A7575C
MTVSRDSDSDSDRDRDRDKGGRDGRIVTFYAYKGGAGRTMALANTAWILASNGKRVLAVDWDLEAPGLHRFLHPFLDPATLGACPGVIDLITEYAEAAAGPVQRMESRHEDYARVQRHTVELAPAALGWEFPEGGALDFLSAGRQNREYSVSATTFDWDRFYDLLGGGRFIDALRADMKRNYDYVLIDSRTGLSDTADICTVHLPDVLVDCFTLSGQSIDGAAAVARQIDERCSDRRITIHPVPMRVDESDPGRAEAGRALARTTFDRFVHGLAGDGLTSYWRGVEIPYRSAYAYEETLAVFGDEPGHTGSLLAAFERLTAVITEGAVTSMPDVDERTRLRIRDAFARPSAPARDDLVLCYVPENRMWADWTEAVLTRAGCRVIPVDVSAAPAPDGTDLGGGDPGVRTVVLLSAAYLKSDRAMDAWERAAAAAPTGSRGGPIPLTVGDIRLSSLFPAHDPVDLFRLDEAQATAALLRAVELPALPELPEGVSGTSSRPGPRFPGTVPRIRNAPPRNPGFTGRATVLERMRDQLGGGLAVVLPQPQALYGLGGVGKTQLALEYAHRFMADYDLVWWIPAEQTDDVVAALAELAVRLGAGSGQDMAADVQEAIDLLRRGEPSARWLLVFDNADDPEDLTRFLPPGGPGHVLVTSRNQAWSQYADALPVDVFLREESVEHLRRRAPGLGQEEAGQLAAALGDLPIAVEQAGAWIAETATPVAQYLEQLARQPAHVLGLNQAPGYPEPVAATWNISVERLRDRSPAAVRLLQLCAFLGPEPISANLLFSKEMIDALKPYDVSLQEKLVLGRVIREIGRFALAKTDQVANAIQVHRLVQAVIRSQLTEEEQREARHAVHRILAGARPDDDDPVDNPENWPRFDTIWPHLAPSEARYCHEPETRRLLIDRVRHLWKRGALVAAEQLAGELRAIWRETLGDHDIQYLYLRFHLATILRSRGRFVEARELDEVTLDRQRSVLGDSHPHTYMTTSALAMDLGSLGRYGEARELAHAAHQGFAEIFHESHPRTLAAANNLALTLRMVGQYARAREIDHEVLGRRTEVLGPEHPYTLSSARHLARDLREVGRYEDSVRLLSRTRASCERTLGKDDPGTLSAATSLAVSLRRAGRPAEALELTTAARDRYRAAYISDHPDHPDLPACELNLAADLFATGDPGGARDLAREVVEAYARVPGEHHPYTLAAVNNLAVYHCATGEADVAEPMLRRTVRSLREVLGDDHPHTLLARLNLAGALAGLDDPQGALELDRQTVPRLSETLGAHHPDTLAAAANLAVGLDRTGRGQEAARVRAGAVAELVRLLGEDHALTRAAREGRRIHRDLEPLAV